MSRKFYTPISLTGLELTNFKIQNLDANPSPYGAGHAYYNTVAKEIRVYDGTNWNAVGGSIEYGLFADRPAAGNAGRVYATTDTQTLYLDNGTTWLQIGAPGNASYVNSVSGTANQITASSSTGDVTLSLPNNVNIADSLTLGGTFAGDSGSITVQTASGTNVFKVDTSTSVNDLYHGYYTYTAATGIVNINALVNLSSEGNSASGFLFVNPSPISSGSTAPALHLESSGDLALRAGADPAHGANGNIILYTGSTSGTGSGKVYIGWNNALDAGGNAANQVATLGDITNAAYITSVDSNVFNVDTGELKLNSVVSAPGTEVHITKLELHLADDTNRGAVLAHPSDGSLTVAAINQLNLESHNGNITFTPDNIVESQGNFQTASGYNITSGNNLYVKNGVYVGGIDTATDGYLHIMDAVGNNDFVVTASAGAATVDLHGNQNFYASQTDGGTQYGSINYDADKNLIIGANQNNLVLQSDSSHSYIGSVTAGNQIATISDIHNIASGLFVLGSVIAASDVNIDLTMPITTVIGGVELNAGNRVLVKSQTDATQNGIYVFDGGTNMLVASTDPEDQALKEGSYTLVTEGTYAAQGWIITAFTAGASTWTQFSAAGEYTQGNGISIASGVISAVVQGTQGMALTSSGIAVNAGTGLEFNGDTGALQVSGYTSLAKKYAATIGDAVTTSFDVIHDFGTQDVQVTIYDTSTYEEVFADVIHANTSKVTVNFAVAPGVGAFRVVVVG